MANPNSNNSNNNDPQKRKSFTTDTERLNSTLNHQRALSNDNKYLLFTVGGENFGTPLLHVQEVVKMTTVRAIPYALKHFKGVMKLRDELVSIVDLRIKFGLLIPANDTGLLIIIRCEKVLIGLLVDEIYSVETYLPAEIEANPAVATLIPSKFLGGFVKKTDQIITLLNLKEGLLTDDLKQISKSETNQAA